ENDHPRNNLSPPLHGVVFFPPSGHADGLRNERGVIGQLGEGGIVTLGAGGSPTLPMGKRLAPVRKAQRPGMPQASHFITGRLRHPGPVHIEWSHVRTGKPVATFPEHALGRTIRVAAEAKACIAAGGRCNLGTSSASAPAPASLLPEKRLNGKLSLFLLGGPCSQPSTSVLRSWC